MLEDCWGWREENLVPWCLYCLLELIPAWAIPPATLRHHFPKTWRKPKQPGSMLAIKQHGRSPGQRSSLFLALVLFSSMERAEISTHPRIRLPGELQTLGLIDWDTWQHIALMLLCSIVFHWIWGSVFRFGGGLRWRAGEAHHSHKYPGFWPSLNRLPCHSFAQTDVLLFSGKVTLSLLLPQFRSQTVFDEALLLCLLLLSNGKDLFKAVRRKKEKILACCHTPCLWRLIWYRAWELWDKELCSCTCQVLPLVFCADPVGSPVWSFFQLLNTWGTSAPRMVFFLPFSLALS